MTLMISAEELKPLSEAAQTARQEWRSAAKASAAEALNVIDKKTSVDDLERLNALVDSLKDKYYDAARLLADAVEYEIDRSQFKAKAEQRN
jgi:hypothetical protein